MERGERRKTYLLYILNLEAEGEVVVTSLLNTDELVMGKEAHGV